MVARLLALAALLSLAPNLATAQSTPDGSVVGSVADSSTHAALESASIVLRSRADSTRVLGIVSQKDGSFAFAHVPFGAYTLECSLIGYKIRRSAAFLLSAARPRMDLGTLPLRPSTLLLDEVEVSTDRGLFDRALDKRVYHVDHDLMAKSSSVSDLLQNIPSVQVDIEGSVSLRGSADVMILIDGKKSALMGKSRADVLEQLPAASIEKIEVITNPSARFTAEGTSGIINIVTKKGAGAGINGDVTGHLGESGRRNGSVTVGYHPARLDLFGNFSDRDDRRTRVGSDVRTLTSAGVVQGYREYNLIDARPRVQVGTLGMNFRPDAKNTVELSGDYFRRRPTRDGFSTIVTSDSTGATLTDHDRVQSGFELDRETGVTAAFEHDFAAQDHTLRIEANDSDNPQSEVAHFVEHWRTPVQPDPASDVTLSTAERLEHVTVDYADPIDAHSKLEAGYALEVHRQDIRSDADSLDVVQGALLANPAQTYRFRLNQVIHAVYGTYRRELGKLSALGGLRGEFARVSSDLVTGALPFSDRYSGLYPSLHLAYQATANGQWQLNFSRRVRRPDSEALNPFPEFTDPYNISAGNPRLRPESIFAYELGYQLTGDHFSFSPTVYFRDRRDGFTQVTQAITDTTFLRIMENLARDRAAGFEPVLTFSVGHTLQANVNGDVFYDQIDASNLGFVGQRSVVSWSGTFNVTLAPRASSMFEVNSSYRSARLTPQGESRPSFVLNMGARQNLLRDKISLTFAISDLLKTQVQDTELDVAGIQQHVIRHRDAQVVYAGVSYHYGRPAKQDKKDKAIPYEDQP